MRRYSCLALDIGGVICADTWESLFFTPRIGLVSRYTLDPAMTAQKGVELWEAFSRSPRVEEDYWRSWEEALGLSIDRALVACLYEEAIWADMSAAPLIRQCLDSGLQVAFVSNSTSFWFPRQIRRAGLDDVEQSCPRFLSHETGLSKTHTQGGLAQLAARVDAKNILFVDDRAENAAAAQKLGMTALHYTKQAYKDLATACAPPQFSLMLMKA